MGTNLFSAHVQLYNAQAALASLHVYTRSTLMLPLPVVFIVYKTSVFVLQCLKNTKNVCCVSTAEILYSVKSFSSSVGI